MLATMNSKMLQKNEGVTKKKLCGSKIVEIL